MDSSSSSSSSPSSLAPAEKKYNFHHVSVSVPIGIPQDPRVVTTGHIPFGPPVIHAEPEKTRHLYEQSPLYTDNSITPSSSSSFQNASFFRVDGHRIVPVINGVEVADDNDVDIEMVVVEDE